MTPHLLAVTEADVHQMHAVAGMIYLFLPMFLALVAGVCLLVTTFRNTLDAGKAASLAGLAGVVVVGIVFMEARSHDARRRASAPATASIPATIVAPPIERYAGGTLGLQQDLERLSDENSRLKTALHKLEARMKHAEGAQKLEALMNPEIAPAPAPVPELTAPRLPGGGELKGGALQAAPGAPTLPPVAPPPKAAPPAEEPRSAEPKQDGAAAPEGAPKPPTGVDGETPAEGERP